MKVFTLGPEGTFSHELAMKFSCSPLALMPTIHGVFAAVARGEGEGIVPIENSEAGGVGDTLDGLMKHRLFITAEMFLPVHHHLSSHVRRDELRVIYAHPQTHEQCSEQVESWGLPVIHTSSNAQSAIEAKKTPNAGAILSEFAASLYGMPIVAKNVENNAGNTTRFVRISRHPARDVSEGKCSILVDPHTDRAGLLHDLLEVFAVRKISLTRIESRPSKRGMGSYVFFIDFAVTAHTAGAVAALREITTVHELGCYPCVAVPA